MKIICFLFFVFENVTVQYSASRAGIAPLPVSPARLVRAVRDLGLSYKRLY